MLNIDFKNLIKRTKKLKILYVEDDKESRTQVVKTLDNFFEHIDIATNGIDGLLQYKSKENNFYDLVISDINMPRMNGIDMIKNIFKINNTQNVLIVTAHNNSEYLEELINLGIKNYIHKPISIKSLLTELLKIIEGMEKKNKKDKDFTKIKKLNHELDALVGSFDTYVIASRTDLKGKITYVSKAYEIISGYTEEELLGKPHNIVRHPDMPASAFKNMWDAIQAGKLWIGEVKNLKKDRSFYWVEAHIAPYYNGDGEHIGYSAIRLDITSKKRAEKLNSEIANLLNNAGQGFLSFGKDLKIDESFSKECLSIFNTLNIFEQNIADILFYNDFNKKNLLEDAISRIVDTDEVMIKEVFLSLLPKENKINNKDIQIEYKLLPDDKFMLVLTDVTNTKKLEFKIKQQKQIQNMIVEIASNKQDFLEIKHDFENFIFNTPNDLRILLRELHTFKGLFAQKEMLNIVPAIHNMETKINKFEEEEYDKIHTLNDHFQLDLNIISSILGHDFLETNHTINIDKNSLNILELKLQKLNIGNIKESLSDILYDFEKFKYESIYNMLNNHTSSAKIMAQKLKKEIYPIEIIGDKYLTIHTKYKPFVKSLIHLFNNCVEHGIEDIETRFKNKKDEIGTISCAYIQINNKLQIIISDDGAGIDINKVSQNAIKNSIRVEQEIDNMNNEEKTNLIFADKLTTNDKVSISSGRGVGMSAILDEVNKLYGKIKIENNIGKGVKFTFTIPLEKGE